MAAIRWPSEKNDGDREARRGATATRKGATDATDATVQINAMDLLGCAARLSSNSSTERLAATHDAGPLAAAAPGSGATAAPGSGATAVARRQKLRQR